MRFVILIIALITAVSLAAGGLRVPAAPITSVDPKQGPLYSTTPLIDLEDIYSYNFLVDIKGVNAKQPITLQIYDPLRNQWIDTNIAGVPDSTITEALDFKVNFALLNFSGLFLGPSRERLVDANNEVIKMGNIPYEISGPDIVVNFKDENAVREPDKDKYKYSVMARSSKSATIDIRIVRDGFGKDGGYYGHPYKCSSSAWNKIEWNGAPYFEEIEFVALEYVPK